jgi:hypothetical protein
MSWITQPRQVAHTQALCVTMKKNVIILFFCLLLVGFTLNKAESEPVEPALAEITPLAIAAPTSTVVAVKRETTINDYIKQYSSEFNIPEAWLNNLASCESTFRPTVYGDGGNAYGLFQYWQPTWNEFARKYGKPLNRSSPKDQVELTAWALKNGYGKRWSCDYKTGLVRTDLIYSNL